jgi:hypothetical protein
VILDKAMDGQIKTRQKVGFLLKLLSVVWLFVFTNLTFACEEPNPNEPNKLQAQHENLLDRGSSQHNHGDCDGECCEDRCDCTIGSCVNLWLVDSTGSPWHTKMFESHDMFRNLYTFTPPPMLKRPPISSY